MEYNTQSDDQGKSLRWLTTAFLNAEICLTDLISLGKLFHNLGPIDNTLVALCISDRYLSLYLVLYLWILSMLVNMLSKDLGNMLLLYLYIKTQHSFLYILSILIKHIKPFKQRLSVAKIRTVGNNTHSSFL